MTSPRIEPRTLKGFRDYLPSAMLARERLIDAARKVYRSYGFSPIDTPALEHLDVLTGKGSDETDKQMYRFQDHGERWVGLRFDLTVPLARFAAQHVQELGVPFKRYHIAPVWRGENTQKGRYREFMQCDFDTIGTLSVASDIETALVIHDLLREIGVEKFVIRINSRQVLTGLLEKLGLADRSAAVLRVLDKLGKIGPEKVIEELTSAVGASPSQAQAVVALADSKGQGDELLRSLEQSVSGSETGLAGVQRLREVLAGVAAAGTHADKLHIDPSIARGLDYYTGVIFETFLDDLPGIGSVCSGGRYDNLAELYTSQQLPGIGASLGLDRLLAALEELGVIDASATPAEIIVPYFAKDRLHDYLRLAKSLRAVGWNVEIYPEAKKLGQQLKYADKKGFRFAVIVGDDEFNSQVCQVKRLASGDSVQVPLDPVAITNELRKA